ncbi:porin [Variovorax terrae]|uniref:Porin n=1 Tax=Variovorax terrae TaxID=2923278 RepID=A0A9X2ASA8_9BURK|nr:porin [Variovorax terrae]MCJ0765111.1 porin [Variovorax terrae]
MRRKMKACGAALGLLCGHAGAQPTAMVFGVVDVGVQRTIGGGNGSVTGVSSSGLGASQIGMRGTEELGGGLRAGFWLESGLNPDTGHGQLTNINNQSSGFVGDGSLTFNRRSYVSLSGSFGELRLGRDFVPTHYNIFEFDPFNANGVARAANFTFSTVGTGNLPTTVVASNSISYWLPPDLGGFYGLAMVARGENASNTSNAKDGNMTSVRLGWRSGAFDMAAALGRTQYAKTATLGDYTHGNLGVSWNAGFAKLFALYNLSKVAVAGGDVRKYTWEVGAHVPVGQVGRLRLSHARLDDRSAATLANADGSLRRTNQARLYGVGYVHDLSRRTALYATYARITNQGQAAYVVSGGVAPRPGSPSSGFEMGIRHAF